MLILEEDKKMQLVAFLTFGQLGYPGFASLPLDVRKDETDITQLHP